MTAARLRDARLWALVLVALGLALFHAATFRTFPMVDMDEAMESNHAYNLLTRGENVYSLYEDLYPKPFAFMQYGLPNTLRPFFNAGLALAFRLGGVTPWTGRFFSLLCGMTGLVLLCWIARRWTGSDAAALGLALLLGLDAVFVFSAHEIRPEAMLLLCSALCFACFEWAERRPEALVAAGFLAAAAPGIHTNGGAVAVSALAALLLRRPRAWRYFLLGGVVGASALLTYVHPERFLPSWVVFGGFFSYAPPVQSFGANLPAMAAAESLRYLAPAFLGYIPVGAGLGWALRLKWAAFTGLWIAALKLYRRDPRLLSLAVWIGLHWLYYALFVTNKNPNYASVFEPFCLLLAVVVLQRAWLSRLSGWPAGRVAIAGLAGAAVLGAGSYFLTGLFLALLLILPEVKASRRLEEMLAPLLAALLFVFCVRIFAPWAFGAMLADGVRRLAGAPGVLALAGAAAAAALVLRARPRERAALSAGWAAVALTFALGAAALSDAALVLRDARRTVDYDAIAARARALVPPGAKVLGPQLLWFAFQDRPYRDWDGLSYAHWLTGKTDVTEYARPWRPDYLITDCRFADIFLRRRTLRQTFSVPLTQVGRIDDGREYCHPLTFYRFRW